MIWWAVIYWLAINTMGVGVIVGSMCNCKKEKDIPSIKKPILDAKDNSHKEYSSDYFKNMVEENNSKAMNSILKEVSDYFSAKTSTSTYLVYHDTYQKVPFSLLSETFNKYGMKMLTLSNEKFTHEDYCNRYTLRVKIKENNHD